MHLACVIMRMSMEESLVAATINAAASVGRAETHGSLEVGKIGDLIVADITRLAIHFPTLKLLLILIILH